ncbi:hypothetical protein GUJ93_ZPchr0014g46534 [Zizania palustris]|uniref:Uncharacterized protein n=1 Tax=Zizania palustris TaxID=103762 RepID=A0A8J5TLE2_ZIZPA|nr:hypothetical protein GUJ93_ZPchr0014g46534 [Zizania palustris]
MSRRWMAGYVASLDTRAFFSLHSTVRRAPQHCTHLAVALWEPLTGLARRVRLMTVPAARAARGLTVSPVDTSTNAYLPIGPGYRKIKPEATCTELNG